jgi:hypothetical protein
MSDYEWWRAGRTALMKAAARGRVDAVMKILDDGIDVNSRMVQCTNREDCTLLWMIQKTS